MSTIKICGLTCVDDAQAASTSGADLLGLVFHRPSPRFVEPNEASRLTEAVAARWIGVFVDTDPEEILRIADAADLHGVQLHGGGSAAAVERLHRAGLHVIVAHRVSRQEDLATVGRSGADVDLLDTFDPDRPGGTGRSFDWRLAADVSRTHRVLLAGGLTPENVGRAIRTIRPWGVDVSSGVESVPGCKDPDKVRRFVDAARTAFGREGDRDEHER